MNTVALLLVTVVGSCWHLSGVARGLSVGKEKCDADRLAVYRIVLDTHWSKSLFPKQYPEVRPPAQWSKLVGRTHDDSFSLFRLGATASRGLQMFTETGRSDALEEESQGEYGVCDEFNGPPIGSGSGRTETDFFIDGNHTRVSVVTRLVPSPDWFIGLDSLDLCSGGFWIDAIAVEVHPLDAGTDDGFTFTAPNWPSEPRQKVSRISSQSPRHPANSFFYPDMDQLPTIATFHLIKEKVYKLSSDQRRPPPPPTSSPAANHTTTLDNSGGGGGGGGGGDGDGASAAPVASALHDRLEDMSNDLAVTLAPPPHYHHQGRGGHKHQHGKNKHGKKGGRRVPQPCQVGAWSPWTSCSVSCGIGDQSRSRSVMRHARRGGHPCPPLAETRWCGEHTKCPQNFFNW